jgi:hypothetical protein
LSNTRHYLDSNNTEINDCRDIRPKREVAMERIFRNKKGGITTKKYRYPTDSGHIRTSDVSYYLKRVNPCVWLELIKISVASQFSSQKEVEEYLAVSPRTAWTYRHAFKSPNLL